MTRSVILKKISPSGNGKLTLWKTLSSHLSYIKYKQIQVQWVFRYHKNHSSGLFMSFMIPLRPKRSAWRGSSVGCASAWHEDGRRFDIRTRFCGCDWNHFYGHSLPTADSSTAVVSYWRKDVHLVLDSCLGSLHRNSVVRLTDRLDMTIVVD